MYSEPGDQVWCTVVLSLDPAVGRWYQSVMQTPRLCYSESKHGYVHQQDMPDTLPDLSSELLTLALNDLEIIEQDAGYSIDMGTWHATGLHGKCYVCFSGAVMAQTLKVDLHVNTPPEAFIPRVEKKLCALDLFRRGHTLEGLLMMPLSYVPRPPWGEVARVVAGYKADPAGFKRDMRQLVQDLKEAGR